MAGGQDKIAMQTDFVRLIFLSPIFMTYSLSHTWDTELQLFVNFFGAQLRVLESAFASCVRDDPRLNTWKCINYVCILDISLCLVLWWCAHLEHQHIPLGNLSSHIHIPKMWLHTPPRGLHCHILMDRQNHPELTQVNKASWKEFNHTNITWHVSLPEALAQLLGLDQDAPYADWQTLVAWSVTVAWKKVESWYHLHTGNLNCVNLL